MGPASPSTIRKAPRSSPRLSAMRPPSARTGDRPCRRPGTGFLASRRDDRVRRFAHRRAWRCRRAGFRDRYQRGGACAGDPDAAIASFQDDGNPGRGRTRPRRHAQGPDPSYHRRDRHGWRDRPCDRISWDCFRKYERRRTADSLQHVDRRRRARRTDRARRYRFFLSQRPPLRAAGRGVGSCGRMVALAPHG